MLGVSRTRVRQLEGHSLHPKRNESGVYQFDRAEVLRLVASRTGPTSRHIGRQSPGISSRTSSVCFEPAPRSSRSSSRPNSISTPSSSCLRSTALRWAHVLVGPTRPTLAAMPRSKKPCRESGNANGARAVRSEVSLLLLQALHHQLDDELANRAALLERAKLRTPKQLGRNVDREP